MDVFKSFKQFFWMYLKVIKYKEIINKNIWKNQIFKKKSPAAGLKNPIFERFRDVQKNVFDFLLRFFQCQTNSNWYWFGNVPRNKQNKLSRV